jgi:hypothetical protein
MIVPKALSKVRNQILSDIFLTRKITFLLWNYPKTNTAFSDLLLTIAPNAVIESANDSKDFLSKYTKYQPNMIFIHSFLNETNLLESVLIIRRLELGKHTPIIVISENLNSDKFDGYEIDGEIASSCTKEDVVVLLKKWLD